jgi:nucleoid-associated protein YgaU
MSKEAKIGLGVIVALVIVAGGVASWKFWPRSALTAQANIDPKEKEKAEKEAKNGKLDFKPGESKLHPGAGHPQKKENDKDIWDVGSYRKQRQQGGEATAIAPPPTMPGPPNPDNLDPNDRYNLNGQLGVLPSSDPPAPPGDAAVATAGGGRHRRDLFTERSNEEYRSQDKFNIEGQVPSVDGPAGPPPQKLRGENRPDGISKHGPTAGGEHYGMANLDNQPPAIYRDNVRGGNNPDRGPSAAFVGREPHRPGGKGLGGFKEPTSTAKNGSRGDGTYDVQPNDSFWTVSEKVYGTNAYFKALEALNRGKAVDGQLKVGQNILTPDVSELEKKYRELCPKEEHREVLQNRDATLVSARNLQGTRSYTVVEGDTLFDIARYELGKASRWSEIYELNQNVLGKDFDYLVPGTELAIPEDTPTRPDPVTRRPDWGHRR